MTQRSNRTQKKKDSECKSNRKQRPEIDPRVAANESVASRLPPACTIRIVRICDIHFRLEAFVDQGLSQHSSGGLYVTCTNHDPVPAMRQEADANQRTVYTCLLQEAADTAIFKQAFDHFRLGPVADVDDLDQIGPG